MEGANRTSLHRVSSCPIRIHSAYGQFRSDCEILIGVNERKASLESKLAKATSEYIVVFGNWLATSKLRMPSVRDVRGNNYIPAWFSCEAYLETINRSSTTRIKFYFTRHQRRNAQLSRWNCFPFVKTAGLHKRITRTVIPLWKCCWILCRND